MTDSQATAHSPEQSATKTAAEPAKKPHRFVRWLRRHHRMLTFIGALIVFGTFIVKDALREELRDFVDSIQNAQNTYLVRMDISKVELYVKSLNRYIRYEQPSEQEIRIDSLKRDIDDLVGMAQYQAVQISNINLLLQKLTSSTRREMASSIDPIVKKQVEFASSVKEYLNVFETKDQSRVKEVLSRIETLSAQGETLMNSSQLAALELLKRAKEESSQEEEHYRFYTWASYVLYALGWGLGLVGRLVGIGGAGGDD